MSKLFFTVASHRRYPSDVYKYMKSNSSLQMSLKLMHISKYFLYKKFPYYVIRDFNSDGSYAHYTTLHNGETLGDGVDEYRDIEQLPDIFCITGKLYLEYKHDFLLFLIPKIAVCYIKILHLDEVEINFNEFKTLTNGSKVEEFVLQLTSVRYESRKLVELENLLECLPNLKKFKIDSYYDWEYCADYDIPSITSVEKANTVASSKLQEFTLGDLREDFNSVTFFDFLKANPQITFHLRFEKAFASCKWNDIQQRIKKIGHDWKNEGVTTEIHWREGEVTTTLKS